MDAIEFFINGGGGYNISKILQHSTSMFGGSLSFEGSLSFKGSFEGVDSSLYIPLGLYYNQMTEPTILLHDIMKASVLEDDSAFATQQHTRKTRLRLKTTKKHK
jgi:hypothetical protein